MGNKRGKINGGGGRLPERRGGHWVPIAEGPDRVGPGVGDAPGGCGMDPLRRKGERPGAGLACGGKMGLQEKRDGSSYFSEWRIFFSDKKKHTNAQLFFLLTGTSKIKQRVFGPSSHSVSFTSSNFYYISTHA